MHTGTTADEAAARSRLITVDSYSVYLDLTHGGETAWSRIEIRFQSREDGATTFADLDAENTLMVDATVSLSNSGGGLTQYTDGADGHRYVLANCFPTAAPTVFC